MTIGPKTELHIRLDQTTYARLLARAMRQKWSVNQTVATILERALQVRKTEKRGEK